MPVFILTKMHKNEIFEIFEKFENLENAQILTKRIFCEKDENEPNVTDPFFCV